jgi:hypothetical protein
VAQCDENVLTWGNATMTVHDDMRVHHEHCAAHLARLRMLGGDEAGSAPSPALAQQVTQVTSMILAEAEAAGHAVTATMAEGPRAAAAARFLAARLARMAVAAQDAAAAAERGDAAVLLRQLRRLDTLTSAMWAVQATLRPRASGVTPAAAPARRSPPSSW